MRLSRNAQSRRCKIFETGRLKDNKVATVYIPSGGAGYPFPPTDLGTWSGLLDVPEHERKRAKPETLKRLAPRKS